MSGKNKYLERQRTINQTYLDIGEEMGLQKMWDWVQMGLRDPRVVNKDIFGNGRMKKLYEVLKELAEEYHIAFTDHPEADVKQEKMDTILREVWRDELKPFHERYPYIKKIDYNKPPKSWKEG